MPDLQVLLLVLEVLLVSSRGLSVGGQAVSLLLQEVYDLFLLLFSFTFGHRAHERGFLVYFLVLVYAD